MENLKILCAQWCNTKGSDKVWGYFSLGHYSKGATPFGKPVYVFWGARGKSLQIKEHILYAELISLSRSKERKGYKDVEPEKFLEIFPNFYDEVDSKLTFAILAGNKYKAAEQ